MPPKKKNGYFYFLMELRSKMDREYADELAGRIWPGMSQAEREPYNREAKNACQQKGQHTTTKALVNPILQKQQDELDEDINMKENITNHIQCLIGDQILPDEYFHIMHMNNYFITTNKVYYPAEVGLARFNLRDGVANHNVYHSRVKPGQFPIGYMGEAKIASDRIHKIPYTDTANSNMEDVIAAVYGFLKESATYGATPDILPPVYVNDRFRPLVKGILHQLAQDNGYNVKEFRVYSLSFLLFTLRSMVSVDKPFPSVSHAHNELDRDVYDLTPNIACKFHEEEVDNPVPCSRSHVVRMAYLVCDNCCHDIGIQLVAGRHIPVGSHVELLNPESTDTSCGALMQSLGGEHLNSMHGSHAFDMSSIGDEDPSTLYELTYADEPSD